MRKSILFVSQQFPFPLTDGGNIRTFKILEALSSRYDVTLVASVCRGSDPAESLASVRGVCVDAVCLPDVKSRRPGALLAVAARSLLGRLPLAVAWNYNPHIRREVEKRMAATRFHAVHLNHLDSAQYLPRDSGGARLVLDTHNLLFQFYHKAAEVDTNPVRRALARLESARMKTYEFAVFRRMHRVLVCSRRESALLAGQGIPSAEIVPNGVDCGYFHPPASGYDQAPPTVIFTGAMGYRPNSDAAIRFIREVMPLLRKEAPGVRFLAVGKDPPPDLQALALKYPDIAVTGRVPDVRPYVWEAKVFAVPIRLGAGTRLKVLEAFAMGIPAVSTTLGAEGIDHTHGKDILIADAPEEMAKAILSLMRDGGMHRSFSERALALAREKYDWAAVSRGLLQGYEA